MYRIVLLVLWVSCMDLPFFAQSYISMNDSCFNTAYYVNDQLIASPFLIDMDNVKGLAVSDTIIRVNDKVFKNCIFISYSHPLELIQLKNVKLEIERDYKDYSHIYMINNEIVKRSAPDFLIDKNYIWKVELIAFNPSQKNHINDKVLVIRVFAKTAQAEKEDRFHIR